MGPVEAAEAVRLIQPKMVIPMHYRTFPIQTQSADEFIEKVGERTPEVKGLALNRRKLHHLVLRL